MLKPTETLKNTTAEESPTCWMSPPKCINIADLLGRAKIYEDLIKKDGFWEDLQELQNFEKEDGVCCRGGLVYAKICHSTKDTVIRSLMSLRGKQQRIIKGNGFFMWDVLLPTADDCLEVARRELITKDLMMKTEYENRRQTNVAVYEVPTRVIGDPVAIGTRSSPLPN